MSHALVHLDAALAQQPATHAFVIGVGHYPHLVGGGAALFPGHMKMGQLSSPPASARAFASWLSEHHNNPDRPLGSVALLVSDSAQNTFTNPRTKGTTAPVAATIRNIELAFDEAVNVTLGLPVIRTSVDHGTAFDIAGKNRADSGSMKAAIRLAIELAANSTQRCEAASGTVVPLDGCP